jgi:hypothetical protein
VASPGRATAEVTRSNSTATPVAVPPQDDQWDALKRQYKESICTVLEAFEDFKLAPEDTALIAAIATVFIEANKRGLTVPAPHVPPTPLQKATAIRDSIDRYADMPEPIKQGEEEDDSLPF